MSHLSSNLPAAAWAERLEETESLDRVVAFVRPFADWFVAEPARRDLLRGAWLGHAVHPTLTDVPVGLWTAAVTLDLLGGKGARPAAQRLVGLGVLAAVPTAWTGWAEWSGAPAGQQRVGVVHVGGLRPHRRRLRVLVAGPPAGRARTRGRARAGLGGRRSSRPGSSAATSQRSASAARCSDRGG